MIPGSGRSPAGGNGNPLQYSCMENPMDRGAWQATVHRAAKSWTHMHSVQFSSVQSLSCVQLFVAPWIVACQAPLFTEFSRQEYWSGLPFPPAGDLPHPGIKPAFLASPVLAGRCFTTVPSEKLLKVCKIVHKYEAY